jgi:hypothetical protein
MHARKGLKMLAGVVALAVSGHVFAQVDTGSNADLVLNLDDTTTGASYQFDTGLKVSSFTGTASSQLFTLSGTNYSSFESAIGSGDNVIYSIVGATTTGSAPLMIDSTGTKAVAATTNGKAGTAQSNLANALVAESVPLGGDSYITAANAQVPGKGGWNVGGYENNWNTSLLQNDSTVVGTALAFYQYTNQSTTGLSKSGATGTTFAGTWDLTSAGALQYTVQPSSVPLPAPLLLLLSGLGFMGVIKRRGQSAGETPVNGAAV